MPWQKILAVGAIALTAIAAVLLWFFTPTGYGFQGYANTDSIKKQNAVNQRMVFWQRIAIALLVLGTAMQVYVLLLA